MPRYAWVLVGEDVWARLENKEKKTGEMLEDKSEHLPVFRVWWTVIFSQGQLFKIWTGIIYW